MWKNQHSRYYSLLKILLESRWTKKIAEIEFFKSLFYEKSVVFQNYRFTNYVKFVKYHQVCSLVLFCIIEYADKTKSFVLSSIYNSRKNYEPKNKIFQSIISLFFSFSYFSAFVVNSKDEVFVIWILLTEQKLNKTTQNANQSSYCFYYELKDLI